MMTMTSLPKISLSLLSLALFWAFATPDCRAAAERPNIVLILADDLGYGDLGCYGATDAKTPVLDRLAEQGVRFTQHYSNGPECSPTRTAFLTGRYQQRIGGLECAIGVGNVGRYDDAIRLAEQNELGLPAEASVLPSALKEVGYTSVLFGKWHLGYEPKFHPIQHAWDAFFGVIGGNMDYFRHVEPSPLPVLFENETPVEREGYATHLFTNEALKFLQSQDGETPFFLYVPYTVPHTPIQGPDDADKVITLENWNRGTRADYVKMIEDMDSEIGRILEGLEQTGLSDETVLIFASDNGGTNLARNEPLRGTKGTLFEGGIRVPLIVKAPGLLPAGKESDQTSLTMDLTASLLKLAGAEPPAARPLDGIDLIGQVAEARPSIDRTLFWRSRRGDRTWKAVRDGSSKYLLRIDGGGGGGDDGEGENSEEWLFDLADDPSETKDLQAEQPEELERLKTLLKNWESEVQAAR